ncbi:hypothetical protein ACNNMY_05970, partial [Aerococcus urinaeequi]|uniref:hypothetical protein n=1 Tax=Aerococcus urinaeequi TaxID=51665 RepID=UPI003AAD218C
FLFFCKKNIEPMTFFEVISPIYCRASFIVLAIPTYRNLGAVCYNGFIVNYSGAGKVAVLW